MKHKIVLPVLLLGALMLLLRPAAAQKPLQVFVLAGQSNMQRIGIILGQPSLESKRGF